VTGFVGVIGFVTGVAGVIGFVTGPNTICVILTAQ